MELAISKGDLLEKLHRIKATSARATAAMEEKVELVVSSAEVIGGALAISWVNGRYGAGNGVPAKIMGWDADLVVGGVLWVGGMLEMAGKQSDHLQSLGAGALAAYAAREGFNIGSEARAKALAGAVAPPQMQAATHGFGGQASVPMRAAA